MFGFIFLLTYFLSLEAVYISTIPGAIAFFGSVLGLLLSIGRK